MTEILPGLPGSTEDWRRFRRQRSGATILVPERYVRATQKANPIAQALRAEQCYKWGIPCVEWRDGR